MIDCPNCGAPNKRRHTSCWHCREAIVDRFNKYPLHSFAYSRVADLVLFVASLGALVGFFVCLLLQFTYAYIPPQLIKSLLALLSLGAFITFFRLPYEH